MKIIFSLYSDSISVEKWLLFRVSFLLGRTVDIDIFAHFVAKVHKNVIFLNKNP